MTSAADEIDSSSSPSGARIEDGTAAAERRVKEWRRKQRLSREAEERRAAQLLDELHERRQTYIALSEGMPPRLGVK